MKFSKNKFVFEIFKKKHFLFGVEISNEIKFFREQIFYHFYVIYLQKKVICSNKISFYLHKTKIFDLGIMLSGEKFLTHAVMQFLFCENCPII